MTTVPPELEDLLDRCRRDHHAWINGDASGYALPEDGSIMGAVGGFSFGGAMTGERQATFASHWRSGRGEIEFVNGDMTSDLAWIAFVERAVVVFVNDEEERRWDLRVTEVFRRAGQEWQRVHRHADPLVDRRSVAEAAALL